MRVVVAGDTHGKIEELVKAIKMLKPDHLLFTGDYYSDGVKIAKRLNIDWTGVRGNCDLSLKGQLEEQITLAEKNIYLVHGHQYGIKRSLNSLFYKAIEIGADLVLFGHTHVPLCREVDGIWFINPGSASLPRLDTRGSYALIDITDHNFYPRIIKL